MTPTTTTTAKRKAGSLYCSSVVLDFPCCPPGSWPFRLHCAPRGGDSGVAALMSDSTFFDLEEELQAGYYFLGQCADAHGEDPSLVAAASGAAVPARPSASGAASRSASGSSGPLPVSLPLARPLARPRRRAQEEVKTKVRRRAEGREPEVKTQVRSRVLNVLVSSLPTLVRERFESRRAAFRYSQALIFRVALRKSTEASRVAARRLLLSIYALIAHRVPPAAEFQVTEAERRETLRGFQRFALSLRCRLVEHPPPVPEDEREHSPAALLADRARAYLDLPQVTALSGLTITIDYPRDATLFDFYMLVRRALQLPKAHSLSLLYRGSNSFCNRLLGCSSFVRAHPFVRRGRFEAVVHP